MADVSDWDSVPELGFDTATEISLLVLQEAPRHSLCRGTRSACQFVCRRMTLLDTIDGCFMNFAYGWAFSQPVRKVYYNMTITALSVFIALVIGSIELIGLLVDKFNVTSGPFAWIGGLNLDYVGFPHRRAVCHDMGDCDRHVPSRQHRGQVDRAPA